MGHRQAIHSSESTTGPASGCINNYVIFCPIRCPPCSGSSSRCHTLITTRGGPGPFWRRSRPAKRMMNNSALGETRIGPLRTSYPRLISQYETCLAHAAVYLGRLEAKPARTVFFQPVQWTQQTQPNVTERRFIHSRAFADAEEHPSERTSRGCPRSRLPVPPLSRSLMSQYFGLLVLSNSNSPY